MTAPSGTPATPFIAVARKWVDLRPDIDPLTGAVHDDERLYGCSAADDAALEWGLRLGEAWGWPVTAVTAGPAAATPAVRHALATGATRAVRVDLPADAPSDDVAAALSTAISGAVLVLCGDWSVDRGSGSVPALIAARGQRPQALGLVRVAIGPEPGSLTVTRRLDHGRREVLAVDGPAVLSFEGASAELRRAGLASLLAAKQATIDVLAGPTARDPRVRLVHRGPYRPRAATRPAPAADLGPRERILAITGALVDRTPPQTIVAEPGEAADLILDQLRTWGYLD